MGKWKGAFTNNTESEASHRTAGPAHLFDITKGRSSRVAERRKSGEMNFSSMDFMAYILFLLNWAPFCELGQRYWTKDNSEAVFVLS